ncbi:hypothetical protein HQQ94_18455 [Shewanella sp. VB17]|uniref:hypothetical protein n=1 Tax=Shewanella sp. VB17 TaxID=2739432 RepID=UPI001566674C|nr:hypothetical protein [Shewanella sp. VB17]NRD75165.1 hypothetical protein [Shewanella sp. VB17]
MRKLTHFLLLATMMTFSISANEVIKYPNIDGVGSASIGYAILEMLINKEGMPGTLELQKTEVNQDRARKEVEKGDLSLFDTGYKKDLEHGFIPIYRPFDRGLLGWRIFIVNKTGQEKINTIVAENKKFKDLEFTAGQGSGWGDIPILENAGIKVKTSTAIKNLMNMLVGGRFNSFPLGSNEVFQFFNKYGEGLEGITIDQKITLVYPFGRFFYVNKDNNKLASLIETYLDKSLASGNLQKTLENHSFFKDAFSKANLDKRLIIEVENKDFSTAYSKIEASWWYKIN